jgi:hypothetical protein
MSKPTQRINTFHIGVLAVAVAMISLRADAQSSATAFRCEVSGATVYSEKPCADGKAVAPTQDTDAQKARGIDATKQLKDDNKAIDARIDKRASEEAKARSAERAVVAKADRKQAAAEKKAAAKKAKSNTAKMKVAKAKKPKSTSKPSAGSKPA